MKNKRFDKLRKIFASEKFINNDDRDTIQLVLLSCLMGVIGAIGAMGFYGMVHVAKHTILEQGAGYHTYFEEQGLLSEPGDPEKRHSPSSKPPFRRYLLVILPMLGGLVSGLLIYFFAPDAKGHGTDGVIEAYHHKGGRIPIGVPFIKAITSALTIGTGGSAGKEGPIAQIAAGLGAWIARYYQLNRRQTRILVMSGLAAGIGAIFHAPLAAALFAAEVLYRDMDIEKNVIVPGIISSIVAYAVFSSLFGWESLFKTPHMVFENALELIPYTVVAIVVAIGARFFTWFFYKAEHIFTKLPIPFYVKPALGGLLAGCVGYFIPTAMAEGYGIVQGGLLHTMGDPKNITVGLLVSVALGKMVTTTFTISSGGSGGVFGPAIVIGGCLGGAIGITAQELQWMRLDTGAFVIVGMAGFFASAAKTPISTIIMVSELTGNYKLLVPTMWVCIIAYLLNRKHTLYEKQLATRFDAPVEMRQMMAEILARMQIRDVFARKRDRRCTILQENQHVDDIIRAFIHSHQVDYPIVDAEGKFLGIIDQEEVRRLIQERETGMSKMLIVSDLLLHAPTLTLDDNLHTAIRHMSSSGYDELFIVEAGRPIGLVSRRDIVDYYDQRMKNEETRRIQRTDMKAIIAASQEQNIPSGLKLSGLLYSVPCGEKRELLEFLVEQTPLHSDTDRQQLLEQLLQREAIESTAVGDGVAFPHPRERNLQSLYAEITIAVLEHPIDFDAPDGKPVDIVCLIFCSDAIHHLEALKKLSILFSQRDFAQKLRSCPDCEEVLALVEMEKSPQFKFVDYSAKK